MKINESTCLPPAKNFLEHSQLDFHELVIAILIRGLVRFDLEEERRIGGLYRAVQLVVQTVDVFKRGKDGLRCWALIARIKGGLRCPWIL